MDSRIFLTSKSLQLPKVLITSSHLRVTQMQPSKKLHQFCKVLKKRSKFVSVIICLELEETIWI